MERERSLNSGTINDTVTLDRFLKNGCAGCKNYNQYCNKCKFTFKELPTSNIHFERKKSILQRESLDINDRKEFIINNRALLISIFITSFVLTYIWTLFVYWKD